MVRIEGAVSHAVAAAELYLQGGVTGVRVSTDSSEPFSPGDRVEAAGFVDTSGRVAGLCHAVVRRIASGSPPRPVAITPDDILEKNLFAARSYIIAFPGDYEGCLVTFPATLLERQATHAGGSLILAAGKTTVVAILSAADEGRLRGLMPGSEVSLTGIAHTDWEPPSDAWGWLPTVSDRMRLLVRSADDVVVLRQPSWWTPRRLAILAGSLAAVAAGAFLWGVLLRRQAVRLAQRIADEIRLRRDAAVEFEATLRERNRLAVNLHDTVLQTVTGIGYQVAACKDDEGRPSVDVDRHFGLVERMVTHAMRQLRGTVWALKAAAPSGRPFPAALADLAARLGEERDVVIDVGVAETTPTLDELVAGNLLLIAQESLLNALRHADASAIAVRFGPVAPLTVAGPPAVELTVRDDGHGFDPASRPGAREGHFGIEGMCERVERLGGSIAIESQPGSGTTVVVRLPASVPTPADRTGRMVHETASLSP
jgi:signal transduction histidine kinase